MFAPDSGADAAANFLYAIAARNRFQAPQLGVHFVFVIGAIGSHRIGENHHRGGGVFQFQMELFHGPGGFVAIFAQFAPERSLDVAQRRGRFGGPRFSFQCAEVAPVLHRQRRVDLDGIMRRGIDCQSVAIEDAVGHFVALPDFIQAIKVAY